VRGYAGLGAPLAPLKGPGVHLLGDHFHPILILLAPIYRLFPSPLTLLIVQAALLALSAVPMTRLAVARFGTRGGLAIGTAYGLSWSIQQAAGFDFHEICFAVPLLAFSSSAWCGAGLGLAIARDIAVRHGGSLYAAGTTSGASLVAELPQSPRA
jgi:hypothetical protein